ncbi:Hachiman antiphage defense system protein HamA [Methylobacter sp.]|uniref:Hachiman antiphage defense system protein HamA n=1 Tax=Methylobacter sp. TaxID=2051955 RepID=UPI00248A7915|nr:Hachiman antiphage defense system protein HamA [Methylobacter sp.]MDI1279254.1 SAVED domain-containing protein [Methylobacter sp.]MDI1360023.1 SAVED domain-containing protein [Methylobacter sp.]
MLNITNKSEVTIVSSQGHTFNILKLKSEEFGSLVSELIDLLPSHYIAPESIMDILNRLGKGAAAQKLRDKIPAVKNIRSGDIGEVITTDYIEEFTDFTVPIRKLRWRDHRDMAMRGDDVIGIHVNQENQSVRFLKAEAKANMALSRNVLDKARKELDNDDGLPAPHALGFVIDRLKETDNHQLASLIEKVQLVDGIKANQVEHLLFTFTSSNPETLQKEAFESYGGNIKQTSVGFRVNDHQVLIANVYQGITDGLDN